MYPRYGHDADRERFAAFLSSCMPTTDRPPTAAAQVHRIEVRPRAGSGDPKARAVSAAAARVGVAVREAFTTRIYLIEAELDGAQIRGVCEGLLSDPVTEEFQSGVGDALRGAARVEVHPLPGVMDPVAQSVREAIRDLVGVDATVSTGARYDLVGASSEQAAELARRALANPVIHAIHTEPFWPSQLPRGREYRFALTRVPLRDLGDEALVRLSRDAHLFLSLEEMQAIRAEYVRVGREPTDIELETLAQTWSEHCVHKTLKSKIRYRPTDPRAGDVIRWEGRPGHTVHADGSVTIDNLLKRTVAAATFELIDSGVDWTLSVFKDNAGVIAFDDDHAVCIKVETHNHPSAIEPYGGSATGAGGCIRDVIGTGLAAKPIANTDVFCVASPGLAAGSLPPGTLHPRRILQDVVAGVRDYGNRMGIPTLSGAVYFDDRYIGNPLVFCGCIGLMDRDKIKGRARAGDRIIALGGRTGRDGIHGATFSSTELEGTSADEFSHAVQIGNAIEEKRLMDAILRARDHEDGPLFSAITDCGAGGFSSAVGEMGSELGADVHLERAPLKYAGLSYTEIWISEAQERMVLSVPPEKLPELQRICDEEHVELADLGEFGTATAEIILHFHGQEVGRLGTHFLHEGIPQPTREAVWEIVHREPRAASASGRRIGSGTSPVQVTVSSSLLALLKHPNIASKHWIIRQYDHEVQGNTVLKPLVGPANRGPGDAAVIEPVPGTGRGLAISQGLQTGVGDPALGGDPYLMALAAIDECVRNLVCAGADPDRIAILDNFCWPSCGKPENLGQLVRAAEGCYDGAKAYRTPFVSGKDSLNNQLKYTDPATGEQKLIEIPPTLLITGIGIVPELARCTTMDAKPPGNLLILVGGTEPAMGGSHFQALFGLSAAPGAGGEVPRTDLDRGPATARAVAGLIRRGLIASAHDVSDGGLLAAVAEMLIAAPGIGAALDLSAAHTDLFVAAFSESPSRYVLEVAPADLAQVRGLLGDLPCMPIGELNTSGRLTWPGASLDESVEHLAAAWLSPLDW
jgi:phosphoribosylformylglycinamidine synthase subunit PurSL